jgi:hypothetical protein
MSTQTDEPATKMRSLQAHPIRVVSHTNLIYWWPIWLVGFILAGLTYADGTRLAVLPRTTAVKVIEPNKVYELTVANQPALSLNNAAANTAKGQDAFTVRIAQNNNYGIGYSAASKVDLRAAPGLAH